MELFRLTIICGMSDIGAHSRCLLLSCVSLLLATVHSPCVVVVRCVCRDSRSGVFTCMECPGLLNGVLCNHRL